MDKNTTPSHQQSEKAAESRHPSVSNNPQGTALSPPTFQLSASGGKKESGEVEEDSLQMKGADAGEGFAALSPPAENKTGLPDELKSGIENLSGYTMDDVNVHYNSDKPAQLQAHAYAQGTDIHIASGQEQHLPHEAWHVAQQKQGRVEPTTQMKGNVNVNDNASLEQEADVMGQKALQLKESDTTGNLSTGSEALTSKKGKTSGKVAQRFGDGTAEEIEAGERFEELLLKYSQLTGDIRFRLEVQLIGYEGTSEGETILQELTAAKRELGEITTEIKTQSGNIKLASLDPYFVPILEEIMGDGAESDDGGDSGSDIDFGDDDLSDLLPDKGSVDENFRQFDPDLMEKVEAIPLSAEASKKMSSIILQSISGGGGGSSSGQEMDPLAVAEKHEALKTPDYQKEFIQMETFLVGKYVPILERYMEILKEEGWKEIWMDTGKRVHFITGMIKEISASLDFSGATTYFEMNLNPGEYGGHSSDDDGHLMNINSKNRAFYDAKKLFTVVFHEMTHGFQDELMKKGGGGQFDTLINAWMVNRGTPIKTGISATMERQKAYEAQPLEELTHRIETIIEEIFEKNATVAV